MQWPPICIPPSRYLASDFPAGKRSVFRSISDSVRFVLVERYLYEDSHVRFLLIGLKSFQGCTHILIVDARPCRYRSFVISLR